MYKCHKVYQLLELDCVYHSKGQVEEGGLSLKISSLGLWGELLHLLEYMEYSGMLWDALHAGRNPSWIPWDEVFINTST